MSSAVLGSPSRPMASIQSKPGIEVQSQARVASPAVPPGLSLPQDFPPLVTPQKTVPNTGNSVQKINAANVGASTITPIIPLTSAQPVRVAGPTKTPKALDSSSMTTAPVQAVETGLAVHPDTKSPAKSHEPTHPNVSQTPSAGSHGASRPTVELIKKKEDQIEKAKTSELAKKPMEKHQRPNKLDLAAAKDATKKELDSILHAAEQTRPVTPSNKAFKTDALTPSQPSTPITAVSQSSASPAPRQIHARTIRVVQTPKAEVPPRLPAVGANPSIQAVPISKQLSRQPSLASVKQPGTPLNEVASDVASVTSTSQSRTGSPPPSKVGSASIRQSTKSQQKKERQARAKLAEEISKNENSAITAVIEEPIQAPIVGRKKKAKKTAGGVVSAEGVSTASRPSSPRPAEDVVLPDTLPSTPTSPIKDGKKATKATKKESKKDTIAETQRSNKESDVPFEPIPSNSSETSHKTLLNAAFILTQLQNSGQIPQALDLFRNVPGINYRHDLTETDLTESNALPPIAESQRHSLDRGEAICVETSNDKRIIILPDRRTLHGFTPGQAKRYLDLRRQYLASSGPTIFNSPSYSIEKWLHSAPLSTVPFESSRDPSFLQRFPSADPFEITNRFDSPMTRQGPMATNYWSSAGTTMGGDGDGAAVGKMQAGEDGGSGRVMMSGSGGGLSVEEAEKSMGAQRKETEALEKKLAGLMRRNRRLLVGSGR